MGVGAAAGTIAAGTAAAGADIGADALLASTVSSGIIGTGGAFSAASAATGASLLSTVGEIASIGSGAVGAVGALNSANAQAKAAQYQSQVAANNQSIAQADAAQALAAGQQEVETQGIKNRATEGAILAGQAASGVNVNEGSAVDVRTGAAETGQLSELNIESNAQKQAYGYQTQALGFGSQQTLDQYQASQAPTAGLIGAAGSLLSGASGAANQYAKWQQAAGNTGGKAVLL